MTASLSNGPHSRRSAGLGACPNSPAERGALAKALSAIPDTGDDWTVAAFIGSGTSGPDVPGMDLHRRRASVFTATRVEALVAQVVSVRTGGK